MTAHKFHYITLCEELGEVGQFGCDEELSPGDTVLVTSLKSGEPVELEVRVIARVTSMQAGDNTADLLAGLLNHAPGMTSDQLIATLMAGAKPVDADDLPLEVLEHLLESMARAFSLPRVDEGIELGLLKMLRASTDSPRWRHTFMAINETTGQMGMLFSRVDLEPDARVSVTNEDGDQMVRVLGCMSADSDDAMRELLKRASAARKQVLNPHGAH